MFVCDIKHGVTEEESLSFYGYSNQMILSKKSWVQFGKVKAGLPDVPVSWGQSLDSDSCPQRKSDPRISPFFFCKLPGTSLVFVNSELIN
jgi:hypothetical protein